MDQQWSIYKSIGIFCLQHVRLSFFRPQFLILTRGDEPPMILWPEGRPFSLYLSGRFPLYRHVPVVKHTNSLQWNIWFAFDHSSFYKPYAIHMLCKIIPGTMLTIALPKLIQISYSQCNLIGYFILSKMFGAYPTTVVILPSEFSSKYLSTRATAEILISYLHKQMQIKWLIRQIVVVL